MDGEWSIGYLDGGDGGTLGDGCGGETPGKGG